MGWILLEQFVSTASNTLDEEVKASFQAYESLWRARADQLKNVSLVLSRMPQVRAAFGETDNATIRDTAGEVWDKISQPGTLFLIADPDGTVIAAAGTQGAITDAPFVRAAAKDFPAQAPGFVVLGERLYQIVVTPVYVASGQGTALIKVLVAGIPMDGALSQELKTSTGGSDFVFLTHGHIVASTLGPAAQGEIEAGRLPAGQTQQVSLAGSDYYQFPTTLSDVEGNPVGELRILRLDCTLNPLRVRGTWLEIWIAAMPMTSLTSAGAETAKARKGTGPRRCRDWEGPLRCKRAGARPRRDRAAGRDV